MQLSMHFVVTHSHFTLWKLPQMDVLARIRVALPEWKQDIMSALKTSHVFLSVSRNYDLTQKVENIVLIPRICVQLIHRKSGLSISQKLVSVIQGVACEISPACLCRLLKYPFSFGYMRSSDKSGCLRLKFCHP